MSSETFFLLAQMFGAAVVFWTAVLNLREYRRLRKSRPFPTLARIEVIDAARNWNDTFHKAGHGEAIHRLREALFRLDQEEKA